MRKAALVIALISGCATAHPPAAGEPGEELRLELARAYMRTGAYVAALPLIQRSLAERPSDPEVRTLYATVLRERKLYEQAETEFLTVVHAAPRHAPAWAGLGIVYDLLHRPGEAERAHTRSVKLEPKNAAYWNNLGFSRLIAGREEAAIQALEHALALDPSLVVAYNNLGFAYGRRGDDERAQRCFRAAGSDEGAATNLLLVHSLREAAEPTRADEKGGRP